MKLVANPRLTEHSEPNRQTDRLMQTRTIPYKNRLTESVSTRQFAAKAFYVGENIHLRWFLKSHRLPSQQPVAVPIAGGGLAYLYRYGAVVFIDVGQTEIEDFLCQLAPFISRPYEHPEVEELTVCVAPQAREHVESDRVVVKERSSGCLEVVAAVLGKSVALAQYESDIAANFDQIEPFAVRLEKSGRGGRNLRQLLRHIGRALLNEHKMVARVEVTDRPELLWEHPELEQLYLRLEDEFELRERAAILDRKLDLISRTTSTVIDLLQKRRSIRVEWYIVALILLEIALSAYDLFLMR